MALREGCHRLRSAGKLLFLPGVAALTLSAVFAAFTAGLHQLPIQKVAFVLFVLGLLGTVWGAALWLLGWFIEAFAAGPKARSRQPQ